TQRRVLQRAARRHPDLRPRAERDRGPAAGERQRSMSSAALARPLDVAVPATRPPDRRSPPVWLGPLVRARTGSHRQFLLDHPGGAGGAAVWLFSLPAAAIALVNVTQLPGIWGPLVAGLLTGGLTLMPVQLRRWHRLRRMKRQPLVGALADLPDG